MKIRGVVVYGEKRARKLGYPTANIVYSGSETGTAIEPGVWTCWATIEGVRRPAVGVVGMWKLAGGEPSAEVHVLDFDQDLYGDEVEVVFGERLRTLAKFEYAEDLKAQIERDIVKARQLFLAAKQKK